MGGYVRPGGFELLAIGPERALHQPCTTEALQRQAPFREGRLWLGLRTALVAIQVACLTLVGWIGATLTLLPLALRGEPLGRRVWAGAPRVMRLLEPPPPREVLPR
jgi:hypothetical protein